MHHRVNGGLNIADQLVLCQLSHCRVCLSLHQRSMMDLREEKVLQTSVQTMQANLHHHGSTQKENELIESLWPSSIKVSHLNWRHS